MKGGVVQFLAKNIFKFSLDQFENTRYALESGRFWFLRYHGRCKVMSHFFWLYASLNIRPLHCTQEADHLVTLHYVTRIYRQLLESRCSLRSVPSPVASSHRIIFVQNWVFGTQALCRLYSSKLAFKLIWKKQLSRAKPGNCQSLNFTVGGSCYRILFLAYSFQCVTLGLHQQKLIMLTIFLMFLGLSLHFFVGPSSRSSFLTSLRSTLSYFIMTLHSFHGISSWCSTAPGQHPHLFLVLRSFQGRSSEVIHQVHCTAPTLHVPGLYHAPYSCP